MPNPLKTAARRLPAPLRDPLRALWRRLPPRDRRHLLHALEDPARRAAFLNSAHYRYFAEREMRHWSAYQDREPAPADSAAPTPDETAPSAPASRDYRYFAEHPLALREWQRRAAPEGPDPWRWIAARFGGRRHALVLGAGDGTHCRNLVDHAIAARVTAYDIAEGSVRRANAEFARLGYPIEYRVADLNFARLEPGAFDLALANHALHHLIDLEGLLAQLARALEPGRGVLVGEDYVGPRFVELPPAARRAADAVFAELPARLRRGRDGRELRRAVFRDRWEVQHDSPFEAVRSDRILPLLETHFQLETFNPLGGGLLTTILTPVIHNFDPADEDANTWLRWLWEQDMELTRRGAVPNFFAFFTARPK